MNRLRILIGDDHPIFRSGVRDVLSGHEEFEIIAEAENGLIAYQSIIAQRPDIAILDVEMPLLNGLDVARKVLSEKHQTQFIVLTMHKSREYFLDAMQIGVNGYLLKDNAINDLVACVKAVGMGQKYVSEQLNSLLQQSGQEVSASMERVRNLLTPTEKIILKLISEGKTSTEIASLLIVASNTIENHRANMVRKLNLEGKNSLLKFSLLIKPEL